MNLSASHKSWMCTYVFRVVERVTECVALVAVCCTCCSVLHLLQCVALVAVCCTCCSVLHLLQCVALVAVCCNVLQSVWRAVCYSELQL